MPAGSVCETLLDRYELRLPTLPMPTVAVIHGHCLGGGLEVALACKFRIAVKGAKLGFPEVLLGIHPGLGGTYRLTALIDPLEAMTMMLTGKNAYSDKAGRMGLVDAVVEERHVANAVRAAVDGKLKRPTGSWKKAAFALGPARRLAGSRMRAEAENQAASKHYPAPYRLIALWENHGGDTKRMQTAEIASFSELLAGQPAQNLIRVFFLRERLKGFGKAKAASHTSTSSAQARWAATSSRGARRGASQSRLPISTKRHSPGLLAVRRNSMTTSCIPASSGATRWIA